MKPYAEQFYKSRAWQDTRRAYFKMQGGLCERCIAKGMYKHGDIVHHKTHLTPENIHNPSIALSFDNLELLCRDCHAEEHIKKRVKRRYSIDQDGKVASYS